MVKARKQREADPPVEQDKELGLEVLMKEYDTLRDLFTHTESSAQGMFNFYLTLVSTVVGALVLLSQFGSSAPGLLRTRVIVSLLLFFAAGVGSVYLSALTGRYAHMARYARALDALRRHLLRRFDAPLPPLYADFLQPAEEPRRERPGLSWLFPTGTFQFFIGVTNSLSLAAATWFLLAAGGAGVDMLGRSVTIAGIVFALAFTLYNVYSHALIHTLGERFGVQIDTQRDLPLIAGRQ